MWILVRPKGEEKRYVQDHSKYNKPQELNDKLYFILHLFIFNCAFLIFFFKIQRARGSLTGKKT